VGGIGMIEYKTFIPETERGSVDVMITTSDNITKENKVEMNWSCCGTVSIESAQAFCESLIEAIIYAEEMQYLMEESE
jgi:hypothetical protein